VQIELANNGDDCTVIMETEDYPKFTENLHSWFMLMGFNMTIEQPTHVFEQIDFCQTRPVFDGENYVMVRNILNIAKDCISVVYNDTLQSLYGYYKVLGDGGLSLTGGIPIWQNFYRVLHNSIPPGKYKHHLQNESGMMMLGKDMDRKFHIPTQAARFSFYLAFGIEPDLQIHLEKQYDNINIGWNNMNQTFSKDYMENFPIN